MSEAAEASGSSQSASIQTQALDRMSDANPSGSVELPTISTVTTDEVVDDLDEYKRRYTDILIKSKGKFERAMIRAARGNYRRKMGIYLRIIDERWSNNHNSFEIPKSLLKTAVLFSQNGHETIRLLSERCPQLLFPTLSEKTEQTILHLVVARQDSIGTRIILEGMKSTENGEILVNQYIHSCLVSASDPEMEDTCYEAELPLSMAAWNCDIETLEVLLDFGASVAEKNTKNENVFHSLIEMASKEDCRIDRERMRRLTQVFEYLITQGLSYHEDTLVEKQFLSSLLADKNKEELCPLALAAKRSSQEMFKLLINCPGVYKLLDTVEGISNIYSYDITDVDSAPKCSGKSVLELIMANSHERPSQYFQFTEICPILNIIRDKWQSYRKWYWSWGFVHLLLMTINTLISVSGLPRSLETRSSLSIVNTSQTVNVERLSPKQAVVTYLAGSFDILHLAYAIFLIGQEVNQLIKRHPALSQLTNPVGNAYYRALIILFGISTVISFSLHYYDQSASPIPRCCELIFGWAFLMFFTRGIKTFSFFTVIMQAAFGDLLRFFIVYSVILVPYSAAMTIIFQNPESITVEFANFWSSLFSMFQLTIGLIELDVTNGSNYPALALTLYITFLAMAYILLLNMVIALLSETCSRVSSNRQSQWHLQKLGIILYIESRLLPRHRKVCGSWQDVKLFHRDSPQNQHTPRGIKQQLLPKDSRNASQNTSVTEKRLHYKVKSLVQSSKPATKHPNTVIDSLKDEHDELDGCERQELQHLDELEHRENVMRDGSNPGNTGNVFGQSMKRDLNATINPVIKTQNRLRRERSKLDKHKKNHVTPAPAD